MILIQIQIEQRESTKYYDEFRFLESKLVR
jgi:hypothetical protein